MKAVKPHEFFRLGFDQILQEGKRQEEIHSANIGEYDFVKGVHAFYCQEVIPCIVQNDWVFEAALQFASDYAIQCFRYLQLRKREDQRVQSHLEQINERVIDLLAQAEIEGVAPVASTTDLAKASDFINLIQVEQLDDDWRSRVRDLYEEAVDHEYQQLIVTLRGLRDHFEINLPRIMFVVRRVMKVAQGLPPKKSDNRLLQPSDYIDWYSNHSDINHPFQPVLAERREFYRVGRNVSSHHIGLQWDPQKNTVFLPDRDNPLTVDVHEFQRVSRYLVHFCDIGVRGILIGFCERERGVVSSMLVSEFTKALQD